MAQRDLHLDPDSHATDPVAGLWLAALRECRSRTVEVLEDVVDLDSDHPMTGNSIGTLLYHIAAIEADWLFVEVREVAIPERLDSILPWDVRQSSGRLTPVRDVSLEELLRRLDVVREEVLGTYRSMSIEDFQRRRQLPDYDVSPVWVAHHLIQHEAGHRVEIEMLRDSLKQEQR